MAMIYLSKQFADVAKAAFQPPKAFSKIPREDHLTVMYGGTIGFLGIQVALIRENMPEEFEAAGGAEGLLKRILEKADDYGAKMRDAREKAARKADLAKAPAAAEAKPEQSASP
jgi:hypothetical protein